MKKKKMNKKIIVFIMGIVILTIICLLFIDNKNIDYERFIFNNEETTDNEVKVIHLTDLHFPKIKINIKDMLEFIDSEEPDFIAITGDIIDRSAKIESCGVYDFVSELKEIAPIYYVNGNHESTNANVSKLYRYLLNSGVNFLNNESVNINVKGKEVTIIGLTNNVDYHSKWITEDNENSYRILLAHHPEKWSSYISDENLIKPNLVLTGHAHGGQVRLFGRGLIAPNQGLFPKYNSGLYTTSNAEIKMIVSRGIGNSLFPLRFNNKPHIPIITF